MPCSHITVVPAGVPNTPLDKAHFWALNDVICKADDKNGMLLKLLETRSTMSIGWKAFGSYTKSIAEAHERSNRESPMTPVSPVREKKAVTLESDSDESPSFGWTRTLPFQGSKPPPTGETPNLREIGLQGTSPVEKRKFLSWSSQLDHTTRLNGLKDEVSGLRNSLDPLIKSLEVPRKGDCILAVKPDGEWYLLPISN
jgi:hypothetical protein